jgi:glutathione-regulated potassium-efflux system ancillary protein KefC
MFSFDMMADYYFVTRVGIPHLRSEKWGAPFTLLILFLAKMAAKITFVFPAVQFHRYKGAAGVYYTLMMSTGLTFGTISALFGLNHKVISQAQYSFLVGTVIASAVIPTLIANSFFLPRHLLPPIPEGDPEKKGLEEPEDAEVV